MWSAAVRQSAKSFLRQRSRRHLAIRPFTCSSLSSSPLPSSPLRRQDEPFLQGTSAAYIDQMYEAWLHDPKSVHVSWRVYFDAVCFGCLIGSIYSILFPMFTDK
jgi:2-oxoglutarate dehydrogenase E1 component